jgi:hypothetical protein
VNSASRVKLPPLAAPVYDTKRNRPVQQLYQPK